jgi:alpha-N-arabinofuranosidase
VRTVGDRELQTVSVSASRKDGRALISLTNLDAELPIEVELDLRGGQVLGTSARILTAESLTSHNTPAAAPAVAVAAHDDGVKLDGGALRVSLPAHSFVTVEVTLA